MTRDRLAYELVKVLNPNQIECPELFHTTTWSDGAVMYRHFQVRRWPKAKLLELVAKVIAARSNEMN